MPSSNSCAEICYNKAVVKEFSCTMSYLIMYYQDTHQRLHSKQMKNFYDILIYSSN